MARLIRCYARCSWHGGRPLGTGTQTRSSRSTTTRVLRKTVVRGCERRWRKPRSDTVPRMSTFSDAEEGRAHVSEARVAVVFTQAGMSRRSCCTERRSRYNGRCSGSVTRRRSSRSQASRICYIRQVRGGCQCAPTGAHGPPVKFCRTKKTQNFLLRQILRPICGCGGYIPRCTHVTDGDSREATPGHARLDQQPCESAECHRCAAANEKRTSTSVGVSLYCMIVAALAYLT